MQTVNRSDFILKSSPSRKTEAIDPNQAVTISFSNLIYKVNSGQRTILNNLTGTCKPGQVTAIMGGSGAGKTSLLNILAKRIDRGPKVQLGGQLNANGKTYDANKFAQFAAYVMQNDVLFGTLTPREVLEFAANLKYADKEEKLFRVNDTIKSLKLEKCQNSLIGNELVKGISGGERKRTSIGLELMSDPYCVLLDEPTSGLDSFTAFILIDLLKGLAKNKNRTIVFTIHQPSSDIFQLFDCIMLLVLGQFVFQGKKDELVKYFASFGYQCPQTSNPLDYLMAVMHDMKNSEDALVFFDNYNQKIAPSILDQIKNVEQFEISRKVIQTTFLYQISQICARGLINQKRDKFQVKGRIFMSIFMGLFQGGVYWKIGDMNHGQMSMQSMSGYMFFAVMSNFMTALNPIIISFPAERDVFLREENSKLYTTAAYFIGKSSVEMPFLLIFPIIQQLIAYWMIDLNYLTADIVIVNIFICILLGICGNSCGLMAGTIFKDSKVATSIVPVVIMPIVLFSGFWANQSLFMDWIGWLQYLSPMKYGFEALMRNQYQDQAFTNTYQDPDPILHYGFSIGQWECIGILIGFIIIFRFIAFIFLNISKTKQQ